MVEQIWRDLLFRTHATTVGAITSLALAAIDTALWDLRCRKAGLPLHVMAGGAQERVPLYTTEGGWLHIETAALVEDALAAPRRRASAAARSRSAGRCTRTWRGWRRCGRRSATGSRSSPTPTRPSPSTRRSAARATTRQSTSAGSRSRCRPTISAAMSGWPQSTSMPIAVGESLYSHLHFREYLQRGACSIVQVDVARIGGITPWLKTAHLAETFNVPVCPHFLMELHVGAVLRRAERALGRVHPAARRHHHVAA